MLTQLRDLRRLVAPEVRAIFDAPAPKRLGIRRGHSIPCNGNQGAVRRARKAAVRRAMQNTSRRLETCCSLYPPPQGQRRSEFCGADDMFWTTAEGDITSGIVKPRRSLWTPFEG